MLGATLCGRAMERFWERSCEPLTWDGISSVPRAPCWRSIRPVTGVARLDVSIGFTAGWGRVSLASCNGTLLDVDTTVIVLR